MAAFNKFNQFVEDLAEKVHNLGADTIKVLLTNTRAGRRQQREGGSHRNPRRQWLQLPAARRPASPRRHRHRGTYKLVLSDVDRIWPRREHRGLCIHGATA